MKVVIPLLVLSVLAWDAGAEMVCADDLRGAYMWADLVFVGTVQSTRPERLLRTDGELTTFTVKKVIRNNLGQLGRHTQSVPVWVIHWGTACCFYGFEPHADYLVFARVDPEYGLLETNQCFARPLAESAEMVRTMRRRGWLWRHFPWQQGQAAD